MLDILLKSMIIFFSILILISVYFGIFGLIYKSTSIIAVSISSFITILFFKKNIKKVNIKKEEIVAIKIIIVFFLICLYVSINSGLYLVFPHGAGDFANHARSIRIIAKQHKIYDKSSYPQLYYSLAALFYSIYPHTYPINSLLGILFMAISSVPVFLIAKKYSNSKVANLTTFFYLFSITTLFILEQGYFTQIMGQLFFISGLYFILKKNIKLVTLSTISMMSYPIYFMIFVFYWVLFLFFKKDRKMVKSFLFVLLITSIFFISSSYSFIERRLEIVGKYDVPFRNLFLMKGGILTPTLVSLLFFLPSIFFVYKVIKKGKIEELLILIAPFFFIFIVLFLFVYVYLMGYTNDIRHMYLAAKTYYLIVFPLSLYTSRFISKCRKIFINTVVVLYFLYFFIYATVILPEKSNFNNNFFALAEYLDTLKGEFKVGIDEDIIKNKDWESNVFYKSVFDVPDRSYKSGGIAKSEISRVLQFHWAKYKFTKNGIVVYNSKNESVINYNIKNVDYFITEKDLKHKKIKEFGKLNLYMIK